MRARNECCRRRDRRIAVTAEDLLRKAVRPSIWHLDAQIDCIGDRAFREKTSAPHGGRNIVAAFDVYQIIDLICIHAPVELAAVGGYCTAKDVL